MVGDVGAGVEGVVESGELLDQDAGGHAVVDAVVHREAEDVPLGQHHMTGPQQRAAVGAEGGADERHEPGHGVGAGLRAVDLDGDRGDGDRGGPLAQR